MDGVAAGVDLLAGGREPGEGDLGGGGRALLRPVGLGELEALDPHRPPARLTPWSTTLERASTPDAAAVVTDVVDWLSTLTAGAAESPTVTRPYLAVDAASGRSLERVWA